MQRRAEEAAGCSGKGTWSRTSKEAHQTCVRGWNRPGCALLATLARLEDRAYPARARHTS
eukprot:2006023-Rhodomonas_salina.2